MTTNAATMTDALLRRIGCHRPASATSRSLTALHRAFGYAVPYENIGVLLREPMALDPQAAVARVADGTRGGWCYELNGAFSLLLADCGFRVRRALGAGNRQELGDFYIGSHLVLLVDLPDGPWLADVGYGDGPLDPVPLKAHEFRSHFFKCALTPLGAGWWRYRNDPRASAPSFDFHESDEGIADIQRKHDWLSNNPDSPYRKNLVVQRWQTDCHATLRGKVLTLLYPHDRCQHELTTKEAWLAALSQWFDVRLQGDQADQLWQFVEQRHSAWLAGSHRSADTDEGSA